MTAEVREPDRRQRLLHQLRLARQLRAAMEEAAHTAEAAPNQAARIQVLESSQHDINTLVSLTQAVRDRYTLDDYHEYSRFLEQEKKKKRDTEKKAHDLVTDQLVAMAESRDPARKKRARTVPLPTTVAAAAAAPMTTTTEKNNKELKPTPKEPTAGSSAATTTAKHDEATPAAASFQRPASSRTNKELPDTTDTLEESAHSKASSTGRKRRNVKISRRCHDCKSTTSDFRKCNYWFLTGSKCGKTYCQKCLEGKYGMKGNEGVEDSDKDWQ